jgi:hypothetical protein
MVALVRRFLDRAVPSLDLAVGPQMLDIGQPVLVLVLVTGPVDRHEEA